MVRKKAILFKEINDVEGQINNIDNAISQGIVQEQFKSKMENLKKRKTEIEFNYKNLITSMAAIISGVIKKLKN